MLSELEEIIIYKQSSDQPVRQNTIRKTWMKRCVKLCVTLTTTTESVPGCKAANAK